MIADYGLTSKHLENLRSALEACTGDEELFTATRIEIKKGKVKLDLRIRENNQLLKKKIDRMIHLFRDSQKSFYNAYIKSRLPAEAAPGNSETVPPSDTRPEPEPVSDPGK